MRYVRSLILTLLILIAVGAGGAYAVYEHYASDLPDLDQLKDYQPSIMTRVHAGDGRLLAEYATERRVFVPIAAIPPHLVEAVRAAEDRDFFSHGGVNPEAILRAMVQNLMHAGSGRRQIGASTITQQVAKNFLLGNEYSLSRKAKEAILAVRIEQALSKERILELYLNEIAFGRGAYGIATAALTYFNKSVDELTLSEDAYLAAIIKGPANYDPAKHYDAAKARRDWVLDGMVTIGAITEAEADAAKAEPIVLRKRDATEVFSAPYFTEEVRRELVQRFGEDTVYKAGLSVRTSLDPILQTYGDLAIRQGLMSYDRRHGWRGPVTHLNVDPDSNGWTQALAAVPMPAGGAPWKLAFVRGLRGDAAEIGFADGAAGIIPMSELAWARPVLDDQRYGAAPRSPSQVLKRGDVVLVEALGKSESEYATPDGTADSNGKAGHKGGHRAAAAGEPNLARYALRQIPNVSGALVALDPHTGRVLAMNGGWSFEMSQFNRATQAQRQVGSAIKPFVYLAALDNGMTPSTRILDDPIELEQGPGLPKWRPKNFESGEAPGPQTIRVAIEKSLNIVTVRMASTIGIDKIQPYIERLGILDKMPPYYSYVLGAGETTPLRLVTAYAMIDNGGKKITPSLIDRVQDRDGKTIFKHDTRDCPKCGDYDWAPAGQVPSLPDNREQVLDPATAFQMVNILEGVVQRGTAASAVGARFKVPLAGKTGTTNDANDAWFVGFTPDLVVGVYIGFDQPRTLGPREQGASAAAPMFTDFMLQALADKPPVDFRIPPGVRLVRVDETTGRLAEGDDSKAIWEAFKPGTEPGIDDNDQVVQGDGVEAVTGDDNSQAWPADSGTDGGNGGGTLDANGYPNAEGGAYPSSGVYPGAGGPVAPAPNAAPGQLGPMPAPTAAPLQAPVAAPHTAPSTGTGGLY